MNDAVGIAALTSLQGANRQARSYAFLNAAFRRTESGASPVRDALDCLIPFIASYTHNISGKQIDITQLQSYLRSIFGFDIPIYALDQLMPALQSSGYATYQRTHKIYTATSKESDFSVAKDEIDTDFDEIAEDLKSYASTLGFENIPPSGSWDMALINFLKPDPPLAERKFVNLKNVLIDVRETEKMVIGSFLSKLSSEDPIRFEKIVKIFMGILIEDFLSTISEIGTLVSSTDKLIIFYDTSVLLRSLGCSGRLLKTATDELTRYLQDIGCQIRFLPGNETEVSNVITTIVGIKDSGGEIEGETADAVSKGEVSITDLRMLTNAFVEELAKLNIFEFTDPVPTPSALSPHQIDEIAFQGYLQKEALNRGRNYSYQNRVNDAGYLAAVVRLRRGVKARDLATSKYLFVTSNRFLASVSRRFLIKERQLTPVQCPPILHVTNVATIAWLLKDQKLQPKKAERELLTNCYAAVRPDAEWFRFFREGIEKAIGNMEEFGRQPGGGFILQAARRIAQEQSFSNSAIMRELNAVEIIEQSRNIYEQRQIEQNVEKETEIRAAVERTQSEARTQAAENQEKNLNIWANRNAKRIITVFQITILTTFLFLLISDAVNLFSQNSFVWVITKTILAGVSIISLLDIFGFKFVAPLFDRLRIKISRHEYQRLRTSFLKGSNEPSNSN